jgi:hypothetical protein
MLVIRVQEVLIMDLPLIRLLHIRTVSVVKRKGPDRSTEKGKIARKSNLPLLGRRV